MRINQSIWHCKFLGENEDGVQTYSTPKEYKLRYNYLSINPKSGLYSTIQYGKEVTKMWDMIAKRKSFENVFNEGDLLYIEGCQPNIGQTYVNGDGANAIVRSVLPQQLSISVTLEKVLP